MGCSQNECLDPRSGDQLFMPALSVYALAFVGVQPLVDADAEVARVLDYSDIAICALRLVDFLIPLQGAPDRWKYLRTWGRLDLLSSMPVLDAARSGRFAWVLRPARILRDIGATKVLTAIVLATLCSIAILHVEADPASTIQSASDVAWWEIPTITTVEHGGSAPVTPSGLGIAAVLMVAGATFFRHFPACWRPGSFFKGIRSRCGRGAPVRDCRALRRTTGQQAREVTSRAA